MKRLLITLLASAACSLADADIIINEIMQSNIDAVMDDLNEFPDSWVELYNTGDIAIDLKDYKLGITTDPQEAWPLPSSMLPPRMYRLVFCDKAEQNYHTHFRLESGKGCNVYLFKGDEIVDSIEGLKKQPAPNIAYGRRADADEEWGYQAQPTPGAANCGELCTKVLGNPIFSEPGRVIVGKESITLHVSLPADAPEGTVVRFTTDGTEPKASSAPFPETGLWFNSTRTVRAKAFCEGYLSPRSLTQSYIFFPRNFTIPVVSIVTNRKYFYDNKVGIYVNGTYGGGQKNYEYDWRRPINMELFTAEGEESVLNQLCETRVAGAASRSAQLKSLALYANKRFGEKRFDYELFPEQRPGEKDYKSFMMRNAGNDFDYLYMRDAIIQGNMAAHTDIDFQAWRPAIFYLNGEYKGMLNLRERSNDDNIYTNYDGLEDIDMIENWRELKAGTRDDFDDFIAFYTEHGHTWDEYAERLDLMEYINIMIMNLYYCNLDFPGNNIVWWRPRTEGGVWRIVAKDTDFGLGLYNRSDNYNTIEWLYDNNYDPTNAWANGAYHTRLFRRLMEDETFSREFIDRCAIYMGDFLNYDGTWEVWQPMYEQIKYEYPNHRKLINQWWPNYDEELTKAKNWMKNRTNNFYNHLAGFYELGTPRVLKINTNLSDVERVDAAVTVNGVTLTKNRMDGKFFQNRSLTLVGGETAEGRGVVGWQIKVVSNSGQVTTTQVEGNTCTFIMPECLRCEVDAVVGELQGISQVWSDETVTPVRYYDIRGIEHSGLVTGQNIVVMSNGEARIVTNY